MPFGVGWRVGMDGGVQVQPLQSDSKAIAQLVGRRRVSFPLLVLLGALCAVTTISTASCSSAANNPGLPPIPNVQGGECIHIAFFIDARCP